MYKIHSATRVFPAVLSVKGKKIIYVLRLLFRNGFWILAFYDVTEGADTSPISISLRLEQRPSARS